MPSETSYNNAAAWNTAGQLMSTAANVTAQSSINRRTMKYNKEMLALQRQQALDDWQMQNEYNHPSAQMARFREAGLNENLIYGQTNTADAIRSTSAQQWTPKAPDYSGLGESLMSYQDMRIKQAQYDNLRTQNTIMVQDALLRAAQVTESTVRGQQGKFDLDLSSELRNTSLEAAKLSVEKLHNEVSNIGMRSQLVSQQAEKLTFETIRLKQQMGLIPAQGLTAKEFQELEEKIANLQRTGKIQDFEIMLNKLGTTKGDASWERKLVTLLNQFGL